VKIGDFGFTKRLGLNRGTVRVARITHPRWVAPEVSPCWVEGGGRGREQGGRGRKGQGRGGGGGRRKQQCELMDSICKPPGKGEGEGGLQKWRLVAVATAQSKC